MPLSASNPTGTRAAFSRYPAHGKGINFPTTNN